MSSFSNITLSKSLLCHSECILVSRRDQGLHTKDEKTPTQQQMNVEPPWERCLRKIYLDPKHPVNVQKMELH